MHLTRCGERVSRGDELDEGDAAAESCDAVFEYGDSRDLTECGEQLVEVGIGERVVKIRDVDGRLGGGEASGAATVGFVFVGFGGC